MKALRTYLTKSGIIKLRDDLDFILDRLVRKEVGPDIYQQLYGLEQRVSRLMSQLWQSKTEKAAKLVLGYLQQYGKELNTLQAQAIAQGLNVVMGKELVTAVKDTKLIDHIHYAYDMAGNATATKLQLPYALTFVDQKAKDWLAKDTTYWMGNFYNQFIKDAVTATVTEYAINQGQPYSVVGQKIKEVIAGNFPIPPKYLPGSYIRAEGYFSGLASNAVTRATIFGRIEPMVAAEVETYEILNAGDARVCPLCRHMNGKTFSISHAVDMRDKYLAATTPDDIKNIGQWRTLKEVKDWDVAQLAASGMSIPPFHFMCRCDIVVSTFAEYVIPA